MRWSLYLLTIAVTGKNIKGHPPLFKNLKKKYLNQAKNFQIRLPFEQCFLAYLHPEIGWLSLQVILIIFIRLFIWSKMKILSLGKNWQLVQVSSNSYLEVTLGSPLTSQYLSKACLIDSFYVGLPKRFSVHAFSCSISMDNE